MGMKKNERKTNIIDLHIEGLSHPVLQVMACTMGEFSYRELRSVYEQLFLPVTPIEKNSEQWINEGILAGEKVVRFNWDRKVRVSPQKWVDILRTVRIDKVPELSINSPVKREPVRMSVGHLVSALILFLQGQPFEEELSQVKWKNLHVIEDRIMELLAPLAMTKEFVPFASHWHEELLTAIYYRRITIAWDMMENATDIETVREVFFENPLVSEGCRNLMYDTYLYTWEFPHTGKLDEILGRMKGNGELRNRLQAVKLLHEGRPADALKLFAESFKNTKALVYTDSFSNFAYALALGLAKTAQAKSTASKLLRDRKIINYDACYAMMIVLHHLIQSDAADFFRIYPLTKCSDKMGWRLATLFLRHYQVLDPEPPAIEAAAELVKTEGLTYLQWLYADDFAELGLIREQLQEQTGLTTSLLPKVKRTEKWERVIEQVMNLCDNDVSRAKKNRQQMLEMERVAYVVNFRHYNVQPKLQKSKDGGITWSKGRNISLKSFGQESFLTPQDREVASMVQSYSYGWYGQASYELAGENVIEALVGCQSVYSEKTGQRVDIVKEPLQLQVQPHPNGYTVRSNVNLEQAKATGYNIIEQGDKQVTVVKVSNNQKKMLELLREVLVFPKESKQQLTTLLQQLSSDFMVMSPLLKNATELKRVESCPKIAVQIAPDEDHLFNVTLAVKPFGDKPPYQKPAKGMEIVSTTIDGEKVQTERDLKTESQNLKAVEEMLGDANENPMYDNRWHIDTAECLELLERIRQKPEVAFVEWPQGVRMRVVRPMLTADMLHLKISSAGQWFEVEGDIKIGDKEKMKVAELLESLRSAEGNFIRLEGDEYVALSEQLRRNLQAFDKMLLGRSSKQLKIATMNGLQLADLEDLGAKVKADEAFRDMMKRIKEAGKMQFPLPTNIHAELRPYQQEGYEWMSRLAHWGAGACLADDMGLGKTLQSIALMQSRASQGPQLVLMPTSVLLNWQQELRRFAPALTVKVLNQQNADRKQIVNEAEAGDVVLSTYGLLVTEEELLTSRTWTTIVLDEAHTIKNRETQTSKGAMNMKGNFRLMLTGTPLQNHLSEIWNLFQFANPGLLGSYQQFTDRFILPIERDHDQEQQRLLRRILSPFLLRRTKEDVLNELPEKTEITLRVELSSDEQALYDNLRQQAIANLEEGSKSALQTLTEITRLRQAACHPRLINTKLQIPSSKMQAFLELVGNLRQSGHRALVFSQFTTHLALVREELDKEHIPYLYLDGSTSAQERNKLVKKFQTGDEPLFLISLKAGGLGLNLTAADFVIHLDPWWNPAIEDQASDRAHRIGQERPVTVYRLIAAGTIEEKIIRLHQNKRSMADALLQDADMFSQISADDVIRLLRESVDAIQ